MQLMDLSPDMHVSPDKVVIRNLQEYPKPQLLLQHQILQLPNN
jgi:hypothetical protein